MTGRMILAFALVAALGLLVGRVAVYAVAVAP